jgi:hypothetical protein
MTLTETGESRIRGYLYVFEQALRSSGRASLAADAVREVESHIRERVAESSGMPNERDALEAILTRFGSPSTVARAYSLEMIMEEAAVGGRLVAVLRSLFHIAPLGAMRFFLALLLFTGYGMGASLIFTALLKPIFPHNVGVWVHKGFSLGAQFPAPDGIEPLGGYWIIPICLTAGLGLLILTHRAARRWVGTLRDALRRGKVPA